MNDNNSGDPLSQWKPSTPEEVRDAFREVRRLADLADFAPDRLIREVKRHLRPSQDEHSILIRWDNWFAKNLPESKIAKELPSLVRLLGRIASGKPAAGKPYSETLRYWAETLEPLLLEFVRDSAEPLVKEAAEARAAATDRASKRIAAAYQSTMRQIVDYEAGYQRVCDLIASAPLMPPKAGSAATGRKGKGPGRPPAKLSRQEKQIQDRWKSRSYRTHAEVDKSLGLPEGTTTEVLERIRKRNERRTK